MKTILKLLALTVALIGGTLCITYLYMKHSAERDYHGTVSSLSGYDAIDLNARLPIPQADGSRRSTLFHATLRTADEKTVLVDSLQGQQVRFQWIETLVRRRGAACACGSWIEIATVGPRPRMLLWLHGIGVLLKTPQIAEFEMEDFEPQSLYEALSRHGIDFTQEAE